MRYSSSCFSHDRVSTLPSERATASRNPGKIYVNFVLKSEKLPEDN